jgi:hypothetical protein
MDGIHGFQNLLRTFHISSSVSGNLYHISNCQQAVDEYWAAFAESNQDQHCGLKLSKSGQQYKDLCSFIAEESMDHHASTVEDAVERLSVGHWQSLQPINSQNALEAIQAQVLKDNKLQTIRGREWNAVNAPTMIDQITHAAKILPTLVNHGDSLDLTNRAMSWQFCRCIILLYCWTTRTLPLLTQDLLHILKNDGEDALRKTSPVFAPLLIRTLAYVQAVHATKPKMKKPPKKKAKKMHPSNEEVQETAELKAAEVESLRQVPSHIIGAQIARDSNSAKLLPKINSHNIGSASDSKHLATEHCFVDFLYQELIKPQVDG